jgi:cbb3-type cytochrome oxidase cytochrome c subunit
MISLALFIVLVSWLAKIFLHFFKHKDFGNIENTKLYNKLKTKWEGL